MLDSSSSEKRIRIIIADDSDLVRDIVRDIIESGLPADCSSARDIDEALQIASDMPIDLALLDYHMPGMDGLSGLHRIMSADVRRVALLSGDQSRDVAFEAIDLGASGFLPKTLPPRTIIDAVRAMCNGEKFSAQHFFA